MKVVVSDIDIYINKKIEALNSRPGGHEWVCVSFNKSKMKGKALCIAHKTDTYREYEEL